MNIETTQNIGLVVVIVMIAIIAIGQVMLEWRRPSRLDLYVKHWAFLDKLREEERLREENIDKEVSSKQRREESAGETEQ